MIAGSDPNCARGFVKKRLPTPYFPFPRFAVRETEPGLAFVRHEGLGSRTSGRVQFQ